MSVEEPRDPPVSLVDHLAELRRRILASLAFVAAATLLAYGFVGRIARAAEALVAPALPEGRLVMITPAEEFFADLKLALFAGLLLAMPLVLREGWAFVRVALYPREIRFLRALLVGSTLSFYAGAFFAWLVAIPFAVSFLVAGSRSHPMLSVDAWFTFIAGTSLVFGLAFETPLAIFAAHRSRLLPAALIARGRRYAVVAIFIFAGVFSPPDVFSQFLVAVPLLFLFEAGLLLCRLFPG